VHIVGSHEWLLDHFGLSPGDIAGRARFLIEKKR
jgi:hypothetical protein